MLYILDGVTFDAQPTNLDKVDRTSGHDWAEKPVIGAAPPFEATGMMPSVVKLAGKIFPRMFGAGAYPTLQDMAQSATPHMLIRGDGTVLGWHAIKLFREGHTYLDSTGLGRVIEFDIDLVSTPSAPSAAGVSAALQTLFA